MANFCSEATTTLDLKQFELTLSLCGVLGFWGDVGYLSAVGAGTGRAV